LLSVLFRVEACENGEWYPVTALGLSFSSSKGLRTSFVLVHALLVPLLTLVQVEGVAGVAAALREGTDGDFGFHQEELLDSSSVIRKCAGCESFFLNGLKLGIFHPSARAVPPATADTAITSA
jgi:hypothetical protein